MVWVSLMQGKYTDTEFSPISLPYPFSPLTSLSETFTVKITGAFTLNARTGGTCKEFRSFFGTPTPSTLRKYWASPSISHSLAALNKSTSTRLENRCNCRSVSESKEFNNAKEVSEMWPLDTSFIQLQKAGLSWRCTFVRWRTCGMLKFQFSYWNGQAPISWLHLLGTGGSWRKSPNKITCIPPIALLLFLRNWHTKLI